MVRISVLYPNEPGKRPRSNERPRALAVPASCP